MPIANAINIASSGSRIFDQLCRRLGSSGAEIRKPDRAVHLGQGVRGGTGRSIPPARADGGTTTTGRSPSRRSPGGDAPWRLWSCSASTSSGSRWTSSMPMRRAAASLAAVLAELRVSLRTEKRLPVHSFGLAAVGNAYRKRGLVLSREASRCPCAPTRRVPPGTRAATQRPAPVGPSAGPEERSGSAGVSCEVLCPGPAELVAE